MLPNPLLCLAPPRSVLDFSAKGSGLTAISLYIKDSTSKTISRDVRFQRADQLQDGVRILGSDEDGFLHIQLALSALCVTSNLTTDGSAGQQCNTGVVQHFDIITFADISGMGFTLVLDDLKLISKDAVSASSIMPPVRGSRRPPIFGDDLPNLRAGRNRYTVKLKPNVSYEAVTAICQELGGQALEPRRFTGTCNTPLQTVSPGAVLQPADVHRDDLKPDSCMMLSCDPCQTGRDMRVHMRCHPLQAAV